MSFMKKVAVAAVASAMTLSLASCGKDTTWGANIDGTELRAGILIYFQDSAVYQAYEYMNETDTDVLAITIEEQPAKTWINNQVKKSMQEYVAIENKFKELGITFENNEEKTVQNIVEQWWPYIQKDFENLGISKQSYLDVILNQEKRSAVFDYYYGENGELAVSDDEIKNYITDNYARIKYIEMSLKDGEGNLLKSEGKEELKKMAEEYIERMKNGESFDVISEQYTAYYNALIAEAEAEEENEVSESDETPAETSVSEPETADEEVTTATEETEVTETNTNTDAEKTDVSDETDAAEETEVTDETEPMDEAEEVDYGVVVSIDSPITSTAAASTTEKILSDEIAVGDYALIEEDEAYYIVYKMDIFADETYFDTQKEKVIHTMKDDEFNTTVESWTASQTVDINEAAVDRYKLEKHINN